MCTTPLDSQNDLLRQHAIVYVLEFSYEEREPDRTSERWKTDEYAHTILM